MVGAKVKEAISAGFSSALMSVVTPRHVLWAANWVKNLFSSVEQQCWWSREVAFDQNKIALVVGLADLYIYKCSVCLAVNCCRGLLIGQSALVSCFIDKLSTLAKRDT